MRQFYQTTDMIRSLLMIVVYIGVGIFLCMSSYIGIAVTFPGGVWNYVVGILAILYSFLRIYVLYSKFKISKNDRYE